MKFRIEKVDDTDAAREMHKMAFGGIKWPGDDHEYWIAKDEHGAIVGFASAAHVNSRSVFLSRAAVVPAARGKGLHRKLIKVREIWAREEDCDLIVTYVEGHNYESMMNLIKCGFRFAPNNWALSAAREMRAYHLMYKPSVFRVIPDEEIKAALRDMGD